MAKKKIEKCDIDLRSQFHNEINQKYGKGETLVGMASKMNLMNLQRVSSGCLGLDVGLYGGWPLGRIGLLVGWESTGKTFVTFKTIESFQKTCRHCFKPIEVCCDSKSCGLCEPMRCVLVSTEGFESEWAARLGVDLDELELSLPRSTEEAIEIYEGAIARDDVSLVVLDSMAACSSAKEQKEHVGDSQMGENARLFNKFYRRLNINMSCRYRRKLALIINQYRKDFNSQAHALPGGMMQKYAASIRLVMDKPVYEPINKQWTNLMFNVAKNKTAPPHRKGAIRLWLKDDDNKGIYLGMQDEMATFEHYLDMLGMIKKAKNKWLFDGKEYATKTAILQAIAENGTLFWGYREKVISALNSVNLNVSSKGQ